MATALLNVKTTVTPDREAAFNEWYNHEHIPDLMKFKSVVSARRYKAALPEDRFQYLACALRIGLRAPARDLRAGLAVIGT